MEQSFETQDIEQQEWNKRHLFVEIGPSGFPVSMFGTKKFEGDDYYIGIDLDFDILERNQRYYRNEGKNIQFLKANGAQLPLRDNSADEIFFGNVFNMPRVAQQEGVAERMLDEAMRICKGSGKVTIKATNTPELKPLSRIQELAGKHGFVIEKTLTLKDAEWNKELEQYSRKKGRLEEDDGSYLLYLRKKDTNN